jgi:hypothetical protein
MSEWTMRLPIDLPSANRHGGAATNARHAANAAQYRRQRATYVTELIAAASQVGLSRYPHTIYPNVAAMCPSGHVAEQAEAMALLGVRHVTLTRLWGKGCRAWDSDNLVAACKGLRDAMQVARFRHVKRGGHVIPGAGLVWDDSAKWSAWHYEQRKSDDGKPGVEVRVEEVGL